MGEAVVGGESDGIFHGFRGGVSHGFPVDLDKQVAFIHLQGDKYLDCSYGCCSDERLVAADCSTAAHVQVGLFVLFGGVG